MKKPGKSSYIIIIALSFILFSAFIAMMIAPREKSAVSGDLRISHLEETDGRVDQDHLVMAKVIYRGSPDSVRVTLHYYRGNRFHTLPMYHLRDTKRYGAAVPSGPLGSRVYYYIEAEGAGGERVVLPESAADNFTTEYDYFKIRFEGKVSFILLLLHIVFMLAALFFLIHALHYAMYFLQTGEKAEPMIRSLNAGIITFFITGFPIGWVIEKQVLGNYWEGIPFGWDITDNKTLLILLLWLVFIILKRTDKISLKGFARSIIINTCITIILFLIPHSL